MLRAAAAAATACVSASASASASSVNLVAMTASILSPVRLLFSSPACTLHSVV